MDIPVEWQHDSTICDENANTVAMNLAYYRKYVLSSNVWYHSPILRNNKK